MYIPIYMRLYRPSANKTSSEKNVRAQALIYNHCTGVYMCVSISRKAKGDYDFERLLNIYTSAWKIVYDFDVLFRGG